MWSKIPLIYRITAIAALSLMIVIYAGLWVRDYNESIRIEERAACDAEWNIKEMERQLSIQKANDLAKAKKKSIRSSSMPSGRNELISVFKSGEFSKPID